ncbi:MAG: sulfite exporter TauE/SafE family protein [Pseudolabrys sp.]|nr:sulfite exporter TauE/SafE family protein [Pseudolabrys sp.]
MPLSEIVWLALLIAAAGVVVGIFAGLFGIGGGAVIVPVLYEVFRILAVPESLRMQMCIGTSLAIIVPTTVRSYYAHKARGAVIPQVVRIWSIPAVLGVAIGAVTAAYAPGAVFKIAFVIFATLISARMFLGTERWKLGDDLPGRGWQSLFGFITGLFSSLVGVSGGAVSNAILTFYSRTMQQAVATSSGIGVPITIAGTIGYIIAGWKYMAQFPPLSIGYVSLIGFVFMAPVSSYTASYGVRFAHWLPKRKLEIAFACFLAFASIRFLVTLL